MLASGVLVGVLLHIAVTRGADAPFSHIAQKVKRLFVQEGEKHAIDEKGKISEEKCGKMKVKEKRA